MRLCFISVSLVLITFGFYVAGSNVCGVAVNESEYGQLMAGASCYQYASGGNEYTYVCQSCSATRYEKVLATALLNGKGADDKPCAAGKTCRYDVLASDGCSGTTDNGG
jgi:hypothetical protein